MDTYHANTKSLNHQDEDILKEIWRAFQKERTIRSIDLHNISVSVEQGQALLSGHIAMDLNYQRIEEIARSVTGVQAVHNHLVTDRDLTIQVAQSLGKDDRLSPFILPVISSHGWISLGGKVPSRELQQVTELAAAQIPTVRGVISLPRVMGEREDPPRTAIQPRIGARVYGENGMEGVVTQVIICPENRLVTHAIFRVHQVEGDRQIMWDVLVPVEAMEMVNEDEIILKLNAPALNVFPVFLSGDYPITPPTWEPPYPYKVGSVRWPRNKKTSEGKGSQAQNTNRLPEEKIGNVEQKPSR